MTILKTLKGFHWKSWICASIKESQLVGVFQHHRYHTGYLIKEGFPAFGFISLPEFSYFEGDVNSGWVVLEELNYTLKAAIGLKLVLSSPNNLKPIPEVHKSAK